MKKIIATILFAFALSFTGYAQTKPKRGATPATIKEDLRKLANKIQEAQMKKDDRDELAELLASLANKVAANYNLEKVIGECGGDTDCEEKEKAGKLKSSNKEEKQ